MVAPQSTTGWPKAPFPSDVATHPLLVIDYKKIAADDSEEIDRLHEACTQLGFFYLDGHEIDPEPMFEMGEATFALPEEDLLPFEQGDSGMSAGYKKAGLNNVDKDGNLDTVYFINVAKDDALHYPTVRQRTYPKSCVERMDSITSFISRSDSILLKLLEVLERKIGLPAGTFAKLHTKDELSGSESRCIMKPAAGEKGHIEEGNDKNGGKAAAIGAHTDFGSFSILHHRGTGGLQVLKPGTSDWQYIKPMDGLAVCNVGDTLSVYSGGIFRSNVHRVIPPPGKQSEFTRFSLVYFIRPSFDAELSPLVDQSPIVAKATAQNDYMRTMEKGITNKMWFQRRIANQRVANRKGEETWAQSRGTEHTPLAT